MKSHPSFDKRVNYGLAKDVAVSLMPQKYKERGNFGFESDHWNENFHVAFEIHYGFPVLFEEVTTQRTKMLVLLDQVSLKYFNDIVTTIFDSGIYTTLKKFSEEVYINGIMLDDTNGYTLIF